MPAPESEPRFRPTVQVSVSLARPTLLAERDQCPSKRPRLNLLNQGAQLAKNGRQLIFATHNPNLVVKGDPDKVVTLQSAVIGGPIDENASRIVIDVDGAIETPAVCQAITTVMEGGREAFDLRGKKYHFEQL